MTDDELRTAATRMIGDDYASLSLIDLKNRFTAAIYCHDLLLAELERRGAIEYTKTGMPILPYYADLKVETSLTQWQPN